MKNKYYWIIVFCLFGLIPTLGLAQVTYWQMEDYINQVRLNHDREGMRQNMYKNVE